MRILLVEDDPVVGELVYNGLREERYTVDWVKTCSEANAAVSGHSYSAVILDRILPDSSGDELLKQMRSSVVANMAIILLTAKVELSDKVYGLNLGADDYITKPFQVEELMARLKSVIRRLFQNTDPLVKYGNVEINFAQRVVKLEEHNVSLTPREFSLLRLLIEKRGRILSRSQIEEQMYGWGMEIESNTVEVYIHHLRRKLGKKIIKTIRGVGYTISKNVD